MKVNSNPYYLSNFIGRTQEIGALKALLENSRLITITGTGGVGKTRIAVELINEVSPSFDDRIYFIDCTAVFEEIHILGAIAQSLGIEDFHLENIIRHLNDKKSLLIFDNYEQLASYTTHLKILLESCPQLRILVTSRIVLNIFGEQVFSLQPLSYEHYEDGKKSESVLLFYDRIKQAHHGFQNYESNEEVIIKICQYLGGVPLSLELAAAQLKVLSPQQLFKRMPAFLDFSNQENQESHHRTLRETIDWSYRLLGQSEQLFFQIISIFKGGFSVEAIEFICAKQQQFNLDPLVGLHSLINKNLLNYKENTEGEKRFYFLDTIHAYAFDLLKLSPHYSTLEKLHAIYLVEWAEEVSPELKGSSQFRWLEKMQLEVPNFRLAMLWILTNKEVELGLRLGAALWRFWFIRSYREEGLVWFSQVMQLNAALPDNATLANALEGIGLLQAQLVSPEEGVAYLKKSLTIWLNLENEVMAANLMNHISWLSFRFSDYEDSRKYALEAYAKHFQEDNTRGIALSYCNLSWVEFLKGNFEDAISYIKKEKPLHFESGDLRNYAYALIREGWIKVLTGEHTLAFELLTKAIETLEKIKDAQLTAFGYHVLGKLFLAQGQLETAYQKFELAEKYFKDTRDKVFIALTYCTKSQVCLALNRREEAELLIELAAHIFEMKGENINRISELYSTFALLEWNKNNYLTAAKWYKKALQHNHKKGEKFYLIQNLEGLVKYAFQQKEYVLATKLWAFCKRFRIEIQLPLSVYEDKNMQFIEKILPSKIPINDYKTYCKEGQEMILDQAVLLAYSIVPSSSIQVAEEKDIQLLMTIQNVINARLSEENFDTEELCKALCISRSKLHNKIKNLTGQSTADYIKTYRLNRAKALLETSDLMIGEVASQVGFKDFSHFSKSFFKEFKIKPTDMRRLMNQKHKYSNF